MKHFAGKGRKGKLPFYISVYKQPRVFSDSAVLQSVKCLRNADISSLNN